MASPHIQVQLRSLYRQILRELPSRPSPTPQSRHSRVASAGRTRSSTILTNQSPIQIRIRESFAGAGAGARKNTAASPSAASGAARGAGASLQSTESEGGKEVDGLNVGEGSVVRERIEEAEQFVTYLKAQRTYTMLVERYNPGLGMEEEEKVRLTARRVGMDLPVEYKSGS